MLLLFNKVNVYTTEIKHDGTMQSLRISNFLKHLLMVTSLTPQIPLISVFDRFKSNNWQMKYTIPAAIEFGVLSGIKLSLSTFLAINSANIICCLLMLRRLQYLSMKSFGAVEHMTDCSSDPLLRSTLFNISSARLHPFVALVLSR